MLQNGWTAEIDRLRAENKEIPRLIGKAADFLGTAPELRSIACIDVGIDHDITLRKWLAEAWADNARLKEGKG